LTRRTAVWLGLQVLLVILPAAIHGQNAVVTRSVNLRAGPSTSQAIIERLEPENELWVLSATPVSGYYEARAASGNQGWVYHTFIRITGEIIEPAAAPGAPIAGLYRGCPPEGNATQERYQAGNRLKNRATFPAAGDIDPNVSLSAMVQTGDDENRWDDARAASIVAYVVRAGPTGAESVNCGATQERYTDTHIEVVATSGTTARSRRVFVEVTPRWRDYMESQGQDWTSGTLSQSLTGRWVRFSGWLFFDFHHRGEARNTASTPTGSHIRRATVWELHPVTAVQLCPNNSPTNC
jgi:hypothetical protein